MTFNFREYTLNKLLASGMLKIDKPGIIIYKNPGVLGSKEFETRFIYIPEETYVSLYSDTVNKIGKERTEELWYKIGKDSAARHFLYFKNVNKSKKNMHKLMKYFSTMFSFMGVSVFDEMIVNFEKSKFIFSGEPSQICVTMQSHAYIEGIVSGMMSFLLEKNMEVKSFISKDRKSIIMVSDYKFDEKYFQCDKVFSEIAFHKANLEKNKCIFSGLPTFKDFLKFKVIELSDKGFKLYGRNLVSYEIGTATMFSNHYSKIGEDKLFEKSILDSSVKIISELCLKCKTIDNKIKIVRNLSSALGIGEIYFTRMNNGAVVNLLNPLFIKGNPSFVPYFFQAALTTIYSRKVRLRFKTNTRFEYIFE